MILPTNASIFTTSLMLFLLLFWPQDVCSYCWQVGWNPGFKQAPKIQQINLAIVRVSWDGIVKNRECVDQFLVKYWLIRGVVMAKNGREHGWTEGFKLSEKVENTVNFTDIEVKPKAPYMFQVIAREDKGAIGGVEYNKSPALLFKTSSNVYSGESFIPGVSNELSIIITILTLFGIIVVMGIVYKISGYKPNITIVEEEDDDEDDLLDDNEIDDEDVKGDKLVGNLKTTHIRSSICDITENPDSRMESRRISTITEKKNTTNSIFLI